MPPILYLNQAHFVPIVDVGKERRTLFGPWLPAKSTRYWKYLGDYWPRAGGLSAVNGIGKQLRDPINLGLNRWSMAV